VRVECAGEEEEEPAPIAERPISDVGAYADRLLAEGAAAPSAARLHPATPRRARARQSSATTYTSQVSWFSSTSVRTYSPVPSPSSSTRSQ